MPTEHDEAMPTDDEMREALQKMISSAPSAKLERVYRRVCIAKKRRGGQRNAAERPARLPLSEWQPKHLTETKEAMELLKDGVGLRRALYPVADGAWQAKWFCSDVAQLVQHKSGHAASDRSARATCALAVHALASRVVEEAKAAMAEDERFTGASIDMQKSSQDAGWDKVRTRGSGIVFNGEGDALFRHAVDRVAEHLASSAE